jgi:hypothetical protein
MATASRPPRATSPPAAGRGRDRSIRENSLTESRDVLKANASPKGTTPNVSAWSPACVGAGSEGPGCRTAGAVASRRAASVGIQRRATTGR